MPGEVLVEVEGVWKKFCRRLRHSLWYGLTDLAKEMSGRPHREANLRPNEFWALRDVSFSVRRGEMLALIGPNGAGKSTLLKMLNGVMRLDKGRITMRGRVQALIELGAGFSPILSARENVYINAAVLGMRRAEVDQALPDIIEFAGLADFVETPLQSFSSGMKARLAFAVATQLDPDVLILDEVLAVGDLAFQEKCMRRMEAFRRANKAIIFVTHNLYQVEALCNRALWLDEGGVVSYGAATDVVRAYLDTQQERAFAEAQAEGVGYQARATAAVRAYLDAREEERAAKVIRDAPSRSQPGEIRDVEVVEPSRGEPVQIRAVEVLDGTGRPCTELPFRSDLTVRIQYEAMQPIERPLFTLRFSTEQRDVFETSMLIDGPGPEQVEGPGVVECRIPRLPLTPRVYRVVLFVRSGDGITDVMTIRTVAHFRVTDEGLGGVPMRGPLALTALRRGSPVYVPRTWHFYNGHGGEPVATVEA